MIATRACLLLALVPVLSCSQATSNSSSRERSGHLTVVALDPPERSMVDAATVMEVTLSYSLPSGSPGHYFVAPQFATVSGGSTTSGRIPDGLPPALSETEGTFRFRHALGPLLEDPEVAKPLKFWFYLNVATEGNSSSIVARTGPFRYGVR